MNIGALDQILSALKDLAEVSAKYHKELLSQGFTRPEALQLTMEFQRSIMSGSKGA